LHAGHFLTNPAFLSPAATMHVTQDPAHIIASFQAMDLPAALWDAQNRLICCTTAYEQWAGRPMAQMQGHAPRDIFGTTVWDLIAPHFAQAHTGQTVLYDRQVTHQSAPPHWERIRLTPFTSETGAVQWIVSMAINIDDHIESRDAAVQRATRVQRVLSAVDLPIGGWDREARLVFCNDPYTAWARRGRGQLLGSTLEQIFGPRAWEAAKDAFATAYAGQQADYTRMIQHQEREHWMRITVFPDVEEDGSVQRVFTIAFDIDDEVRAIEALEQSRQRLDRLADNIPYPLTYFDTNFVYRFINKAFAQRFSVQPEECIGKSVREVRGETLWAEHSPYAQLAVSGKEARYERLAQRPDGSKRWTRSSYMPDIDDNGKVRGVYSSTIDIHEIKLAQEALTRRAERDSLTDAFNRSYLMTRLEQDIKTAAQIPFAVFFIDLDGFKQINDRVGHAAGDAVLKAIAQRLTDGLRQDEIVVRFGGDEFVVLTRSVDPASIESMAKRIVAAVCAPVQFEAHMLQVSASVGIAVAPAHANTVNALIRRADEAMYSAKANGKNTWMICPGPLAADAQVA
jgi:diguanylate cyclase (GGDEF)-like protein/PAS domain S-box-containing protein